MEKVVVTFEIPKDQIKTINKILEDKYYNLDEVTSPGISIDEHAAAVKILRMIAAKFLELERNQELEANP